MPLVTIAQQVRTFLAENYMMGQEYNLEDGDSFLENGIIDSTGVLQLVSFLQETCGITVEEGELRPENLDSISNIAAFVDRKRGGAPPEAQGAAAPKPDQGENR